MKDKTHRLRQEILARAAEAEQEDGYRFSKDGFQTFSHKVQQYQQERTLEKVKEIFTGGESLE